jgi:uncharacterized delta-60 repeat protein
MNFRERRRRRRDPVRRAACTVLEALESRRLLSGSVEVVGGGGGGGQVTFDPFTHGTLSAGGNRDGWAAITDGSSRLIVASTERGGSDVILSRYLPVPESTPTAYVRDTTFGGANGVVVDFGGVSDTPSRLAIGPSGAIYVSGGTSLSLGNDEDMAVAKVSAAGGVEWATRVPKAGTSEAATALAVSATGEVALGGLIFPDFDIAVARVAADGTLVTGFGAGGLKVDVTPGIDESLGDVAFDADGNVLAGGTEPDGSATSFFVRTYDATDGHALEAEVVIGFVDPIFSTPVSATLEGLGVVGSDVVAIGRASADVVLARYTPGSAGVPVRFRDSSLTASLVYDVTLSGQTATVVGQGSSARDVFSRTYDLSGAMSRTGGFEASVGFDVKGATVDAAGKIAAAGTTDDAEVAAATASGAGAVIALDAGSGSAGTANIDEALAVAEDGLGNTYVGGYRSSPGGRKQAVVVKQNSGGVAATYVIIPPELDPTLSASVTSLALQGDRLYAGLVTNAGAGYAVIDLVSGSVQTAGILGLFAGLDLSAPTRVAAYGADQFVLAGTAGNGTHDDLFVALLDQFGASQWPLTAVTTDVRDVIAGVEDFDLNSSDVAGALIVLPDGSILVGGMTDYGSADGQFVLANYSAADGSLVGSFGGGDGIVTTDVDVNALDAINALAIQSLPAGDRIVAAGRSDGLFAVARYDLAGGLDTTFGGGDGVVVLGQPTQTGAQGLAIDGATDRIVLAGTSSGANDDFLIVRLNADGTPDASFGAGGVVSHDLGGGADTAMALALDGQTIVVAGSADVAGALLDMAILRVNVEEGGGGTETRVLEITGNGTGAAGANVIMVWADATNIYIQIDGDPVVTVPIVAGGVPLSGIVVNAGDGNDVVTILDGVTLGAQMHGGAGNDVMVGGMGDDVLFGELGDDMLLGRGGGDAFVGGDGNDVLLGGNGRDLLIGGRGADRILGNNQDDILIAGSTVHDTDPAALLDILEVWDGQVAYDVRVTALRNTVLRPDVDVFDDGVVDSLWGNGGQDWFIFNYDGTAKDRVADWKADEIKTDVDPLP